MTMNTEQKQTACLISKESGYGKTLVVLVCFAIMLSVMSIALMQPEKAFAKSSSVINKMLVDQSKCKPGYSKTTSNYDITGDKKKDKMTVKFFDVNKHDPYPQVKFTIYVNGKKRFTSKDWFPEAGCEVRYHRLSNGKPMISFTYGDGMSSFTSVIGIQKGKMKTILTTKNKLINKYCYTPWVKYVKATGNKLRICWWYKVYYKQGGYTMIPLKMDYRLKNGTLKAVDAKSGNLNGRKMAMDKSSKLYTTSTLKKSKGSISKNRVVRIYDVRVKSGKVCFKVKTPSGKMGWVNASKVNTFQLATNMP